MISGLLPMGLQDLLACSIHFITTVYTTASRHDLSSMFNPFNDASYYHPYCIINNWNNQVTLTMRLGPIFTDFSPGRRKSSSVAWPACLTWRRRTPKFSRRSWRGSTTPSQPSTLTGSESTLFRRCQLTLLFLLSVFFFFFFFF